MYNTVMENDTKYKPGEYPEDETVDNGEWEHGYCEECGARLGEDSFDDECECWDY